MGDTPTNETLYKKGRAQSRQDAERFLQYTNSYVTRSLVGNGYD